MTKKSELIKYIEARVAEKVRVVKDDIDTLFADTFSQELKTLIQSEFGTTSDRLSYAYSHLTSEETSKLFNSLKNEYGIRRYVSNIRVSGGFSKFLFDHLMTEVQSVVKGERENVTLRERYPSLSALINDAQVHYGKLDKQKTDLYILKNELITVIDNSPNGAKALESLKKLGMDMSDFEEQKKVTALVPVALSVPITILEGEAK